MEKKYIFAITHSYLLDSYDFHYTRDNIEQSIHERMKILIDIIKKHK